MRILLWGAVPALIALAVHSPPKLLDTALAPPVNPFYELVGVIAGLALTIGTVVFQAGLARGQVKAVTHWLGREIARLAAQFAEGLARVERRLDVIEQFREQMNEHRATTERWQGSAESTLDAHDHRLSALEAPLRAHAEAT